MGLMGVGESGRGSKGMGVNGVGERREGWGERGMGERERGERGKQAIPQLQNRRILYILKMRVSTVAIFAQVLLHHVKKQASF